MSSGYPRAEHVSPINAESAVACKHCGKPLAIPAWDRFQGFLTECPHCHGLHGRAWNIRVLALASFLLNAVSFFFTMRPSRAVVAIVAWAAFFWLVLPRSMAWSANLQAVVFGAFMLGPMLINAVLLVRHQVHLDRAPTARA